MQFDPTSWHLSAVKDDALTHSAKALVGVIAAKAESLVLAQKRTKLAEDAGMAERTMYRALECARDAGWLETDGKVIRLTHPEMTATDGSDTATSGSQTATDGSDGEPPSSSSPPEQNNKVSTPSKNKTQPPSPSPPPDGSSRDTPEQPPSRSTDEEPRDAGEAQSGGAGDEISNPKPDLKPNPKPKFDTKGWPKDDPAEVEQWILEVMQGHGLRPRSGDARNIMHRIEQSAVPPEDRAKYLREDCARLQAKVRDGEVTPSRAKSWIGTEDGVKFWLESASGGKPRDGPKGDDVEVKDPDTWLQKTMRQQEQ